jgi:hypothetical protein
VQVLKLYDPRRSPASWTEIIRPGQFVAFAKDADSELPCDAEGQPVEVTEANCMVFDGFEEARRFCEERAGRFPHLCFEIFDDAGRTKPPLLVVVSPGREHALKGDPRSLRRRRLIAILLLLGALPLFWWDWRTSGTLIVPTLLGINMIVIAARLLHLNLTIREVERTRKERLERHLGEERRRS